MKERKNIDRLYQEGFKDFEATPREEVWKNIASRLEEKQRKRPLIIPLWYKVGGIAATIAIILGLAYFINTGQEAAGTQFVVEDEDIYRPEIEIPENNETIEDASELLNTIMSGDARNSSNSGLANSEYTEESSTNPSEKEKENTPTEKYKADNWQNQALAQNASDEEDSSSEENRNSEALANQNEDSELAESQFEPKNEENSSENQFSEENSEEIVQNSNEEGVDEEKNALAALAEEKNKPTVEIAEAEKGKIRFSTFAAPIFYDNMGSGSAISPNFSNNETNSQVTMAYGVNVAYTLSDKIKIRTGVSKVNLSHDTKEISYTTTAFAQNISSINYRSNLNVVEISDAPTGLPNFDLSNNEFGSVAGTGVIPGEINQQFGFIEVPVEVEYALIDKKFGLSIIGGGSSLFLDENSVSLVSNNQKTELGEANNINNVSFSTNIGVGLGYEIIQNFEVNFEPIFKYQLNTFKNTENVQPFFFGIYSGFSFKF
ncbi:hypothetical protein RM549_07670 [Salegentibacter sp. F188]|uniref:Outer membrane protein beta-barrel domain-containing protein n=1 Tax=Autumnicola patrickiae TaxID=3075591 RepID=A0ABU3E0Y2_9FLAO|nr:hypothetical protein [Salegentibacter sp. F188]MDT0689659.1 hypothetical protein [Salegentibacter sp. F188]